MLQTMIMTIVAIPLVLGMAAALGRSRLPAPAFALLLPLFAAVVSIGIEGMPAFPPVRAAHKFPYVLAAGGFVFALVAWRMRVVAPALAAIGAAIAIGLPAWWMGANILAGNSVKATTVAILAVLAIVGAFVAAARKAETPDGAHLLPQAIFATSLASALVAITGGYMGMAMFNGGLAALAGGYLLVSYVSHIRGNAQALALGGVGAFAFAWVAFMGLVATALLAPKASMAGLIAVGLTLPAAPLAAIVANRLTHFPAALRPLINGLIAAVPALAGILIAGLQFAG
ncbi:hypothetical protein [Rhizobium sp.]